MNFCPGFTDSELEILSRVDTETSAPLFTVFYESEVLENH